MAQVPMLPDIGQLFYNGITYTALNKTSMSGTPVLDDAGRTTKWVEWILKVNGFIVLPDNFKQLTVDSLWVKIRQQLTATGGHLLYSGRGFGSFDINNPANAQGARDVNWGPKPKILNFTPLGGGRSAAIEWQVSVCIPECACPHYKGVPIQFSFDTNLTFGEDGYSVLTVSGSIEIPMTRITQDNRELPDIVDAYRQQFLDPPVIQDYRCTHRDFKQSRDKRTMQWAFTYEEMAPMGVPFGSTIARGSYSVKPAQPGPALCQWVCTLRNTYTIRKDFPRRMAYWSFLLMLMDRMAASVNGIIVNMGNNNPNANNQVASGGPGGAIGLGFRIGQALFGQAPGSLVGVGIDAVNRVVQTTSKGAGNRARKAIIQSFGIDEGTYLDSKTITFDCSWRLFTTFRAILAASGVWRQVTHLPGLATDAPYDTDKVFWSVRMNEIQGYRSWNDITYLPEDDVIVDLCECTPNRPDGPLSDPIRRPVLGEGLRSTAAGFVGGVGGTSDDGSYPEDKGSIAGVVDPNVSWLDYRCNIRVYLDPGMVVHKPLPPQTMKVDDLGVVDFADPATMDAYNANGVNLKSFSSQPDIVQRMATSTYRVCLYGYGIRAGYEVPVPKLLKFGGAAGVVPDQGSWADQSVIANFSGVPIHLTQWRQWYLIPNVPTKAQAPPANYGARIRGDAILPTVIPAARSVSEAGAPGVQLPVFIQGQQ